MSRAEPVAARWAARLPAGLAFALRELRGARQGFAVFLSCLAFGVAAIAGIGSFSRALSDGLEREGRAILGGDAAFTLTQREASDLELGFFSVRGEVSRVASLRAMARTAAGEAALAELKAVDAVYPLAGRLELSPQMSAGALFAPGRGLPGAAAEAALLARLGLRIGDEVRIGDARFEIRAEIVSEPDKLSSGIGLGPRLMISAGDLPATGLIRPGSLVRWSYRLLLPDAAPQTLDALMGAAHERFDDAGFEMRTRAGATPSSSATWIASASSSPWWRSPRCWWAASASPMRCRAISPESARPSPPSRRWAPRAARCSPPTPWKWG